MLTQKQEKAIRQEVWDAIAPVLQEKFGDLLSVAANKRVIPYASEGIECYVNVSVAVVRGKREDDGIPYDPYEEEKKFLEKKQEEDKAKAAKEKAERDKVEKAEAARLARLAAQG